MEPNEDKKPDEVHSGGLLKEVASKDEQVTENERLNQVKDFERLFKDVKLNMEEKEMMRDITEAAK